jgi:hypothetical protein
MTRLTKEHRNVNRITRSLHSGLVAAGLLLAPSAAGASDENIVVATNETDGAAVVRASVQYRPSADGSVDEENVAYALARCVDCQTFAAAFQIVLVPRGWDTFAPHNEAFAANVECEQCVTFATAKQIFVATGGPAYMTGSGHLRMRALQGRLQSLDLASMTIGELVAEADAAYAELVDIASNEIKRVGGVPNDAEVVATRSA